MGNVYGSTLCCKGNLIMSQCEFEINENGHNVISELDEEARIKQLDFEISNIKDTNRVSGIFETSYKDYSLERSRLQKLEKAIYYAKVLKLSIQNHDILQKTLIINALGPEVSIRKAKDGFTYFGSAKKDGPKGAIINDIILPFVNRDLSKNYRGRHFQISYDLTKDTYYLKDLKLGFGAYYKLTSSIELKSNTLFQIGEVFILFTLLPHERETSKIMLKVYGKGSGDIYYFYASDYSENYISIGRQETCEVRLQGNLVSKVHCTIFFTPEKGWVLDDGDLVSNQRSTNGTWIYVGENVEVSDGMAFKSGKIMFKVEIL